MQLSSPYGLATLEPWEFSVRRSHPVVPSAAEVADMAFQMFWSVMALL